MKRQLSLVTLFLLIMLSACVSTKPILISEGGKMLVQLGKAKFVLPEGFTVIEHIPLNSGNKMADAIVIMAKSEKEDYTVIIFTMQKPVSGYEFLITDLKKKFPEAFFYDGNIEYLRHAATYISRMPMSRKLYLEDPVSKVFTGYQYDGVMTRYRFDIYQNFKNQNPYELCCWMEKKQKDPLVYLETIKGKKEELKEFREFSLALIQENVQWFFSVE